jgi:DNA repair exonuclease SbcCD nuclease subunit
MQSSDLEPRLNYSFVHAADLHLDTPFEGLSRTSPRIANALRDASLDAFDALIDLAIKRRAVFVLFSGDIYDGADRGVRAQLRFHRGLSRLDREGIRAFIVHGNHDPLDGWSALKEWPSNTRVFEADDVCAVPVDAAEGRLATIYGISYPKRDVIENLSLRFRRQHLDGLHVALLHCNVGGNGDHKAYSPCSVQDLIRAQMDYWALGHVHKAQIIHRSEPWIVYPGNLQGRSAKPSELGPKGAMVAEVMDGRVTNVDFAPVDKVRFTYLEQRIDAVADLAALEFAIIEQLEVLRTEHDGRGLILRARLTGRGPLRAQLMRQGTVNELLRSLREHCEHFSPFVWWDEIIDESRTALDLDSIEARNDFMSELLSWSRSACMDEDVLAMLAKQIALEKHAKLRKLVSALAEDELPALLEKATLIALERLEEGEER